MVGREALQLRRDSGLATVDVPPVCISAEAVASLALTKHCRELLEPVYHSVAGRAGMKTALLLGICGIAYVAWPYVELYRIGQAFQQGNMPILTADVAWPSVREGLCDDIVQAMTGQDTTTKVVENELPAFGSGFVSAMTTDMVDRLVTPGQLLESLKEDHVSTAQPGYAMLRSAWFTSPTSFEASFRLGSNEPGSPPIRVRLNLTEDGWLPQWRVTRAWVPTEFLRHLASG